MGAYYFKLLLWGFMSEYVAGAMPCKNTVKECFKGVISKGLWKRILWQEFDNENDAIKWAQTVKTKDYKGE